LAVSLLVALQCVARSKVVDDQGNNVVARDTREPQGASVFKSGTEIAEKAPSQGQSKINDRKNMSPVMADQWLSLQETLMQRITELESSIASLSFLRTEMQQLKEVLVSQSLRIDKLESTKSLPKKGELNQEEAEVFAALTRDRNKRSRVEDSSGEDKGLTQK